MRHNATFLYCNHCMSELKQHPEKHRALKKEHIDALLQYYTDNGDRHLLNSDGTLISQRQFDRIKI